MPRFLTALAACAFLLLTGGAAHAACEDYVPGPKPQNTSREDVGADYDTIVDRGWMDFALYEDFPPFSYREDGKPAGVDVEIAQVIAEYIGVDARIRLVPASENVDGDLRNHVWKGPIVGGRVANVMMHVPYSEGLVCRNEQVVLTGQYYNEKIAIAWAKNAYDDAPSPAYFRYDPVGVENDSLADFYLSSAFGGQTREQVRRYTTYAKAMAALRAGEIGAVMGPITQLQGGMKGAEDELAVSDGPLPGLALGEWTLGVAVRHTYRQLAYTVDDAIRAALEDGTIEAIFAKHGLTHRKPDW